MRRNEVNTVGQMRLDAGDHGAFHRSDVGQDDTGGKMVSDIARDDLDGGDRRAEDHQIRAPHTLAGIGRHLVSHADLAHTCADRV